MGGEMDGGNNGGNETGRGGMAGNNCNVKRGGRNNLSSFYRHWDFFANLKMWRMQMIDEDHLLIRCVWWWWWVRGGFFAKKGIEKFIY